MKSRWITHKEADILYVDFSDFGQDLDLLRAELEAVTAAIRRKPENAILGLVDLRKTTLSLEATGVIKGYAPQLGRHIFKAAVVLDNVTGFRRVILSAVSRAGGREAVPFDDLEEAKNWLLDDQ